MFDFKQYPAAQICAHNILASITGYEGHRPRIANYLLSPKSEPSTFHYLTDYIQAAGIIYTQNLNESPPQFTNIEDFLDWADSLSESLLLALRLTAENGPIADPQTILRLSSHFHSSRNLHDISCHWTRLGRFVDCFTFADKNLNQTSLYSALQGVLQYEIIGLTQAAGVFIPRTASSPAVIDPAAFKARIESARSAITA